MTGFSTQNYDKKRSLGGCDAKKAIDPTAANWKPQMQFSAKRSSNLT
jgi:hypothetical protein